jgi:hypothetical protein
MRVISILTAASALASCTMSATPPNRRLASQHEYQQLIADKVAQTPVSCLPHYLSGDMRVIDDETIAFRNGNARVYVAHMQGSCNNLAEGHTALVTHQYGNAQLCRGDIAHVVDTLNGFTVGSCVFGDFVPYMRPAR